MEGGFDITEKFEYDEDVKIVILPDYLEIARDGLGGLPEMARDRVWTSLPTLAPGSPRLVGDRRAWSNKGRTVSRVRHRVLPLTPVPFCLLCQITSAVEALLSADSASRKQEVQAWDGEVRQVSKHAFNLKQLENPARIPPW